MARVPTFAEIGQRIRLLREEKCLDQKDVANFLKVTRPVVTKIENGQKAINSRELAQIASYLGTTSDFLLKEIDDEPLAARFRGESADEDFFEAVSEIEGIFKTIIGQFKIRSHVNGT